MHCLTKIPMCVSIRRFSQSWPKPKSIRKFTIRRSATTNANRRNKWKPVSFRR